MDIQLPCTLSHDFGTLAGGQGCFPLDDRRYHRPSVCQDVLIGIRSLVRFGKARAPLADPVLYPRW
jgi:hypothetical protein